ncbi:MAG: hypothetical protein P0120_01975 [Nitrospira sp.]|nr:hypothetical protein [Nitrospira sp.]
MAVILSFLNLEETLFVVESHPEKARARVNLIIEICSNKLFARGQDAIMNDDVRSYALCTPTVSPFCAFEPFMELAINELMQPTAEASADLRDIISETRTAKERFQSCLEACRTEVLPHAKAIGGKNYKFDVYWSNNRTWLLELIAEMAGVLSEAKSRGLDGLLKVKSVGLAVGANLSLTYAHQFENRVPKSGDSRDILHAIIGSSADVFVTDDGELRRVLNRVPVDGFRAISLEETLAMLPK